MERADGAQATNVPSEGERVGTRVGATQLSTARAGTILRAVLHATLMAACATAPRPAPNAPTPAPSAPATVAESPAAAVVPHAVVPPPAPAVDSSMRPTTSPMSAPTLPAQTIDPTDGSGTVRWVGRDADATLSADDRALLRTVFGVDDVRRLFLPAAAGTGLRYAAHPPGCPDEGRTATFHGACRVVGVRVGFAAPRVPGETWDAYTGRVTRGGARTWAAGGHTAYSGLDALDPEARPAFERLLADARAAGFQVHVRETYRTPERQAFILARNDGRTTTATSAHSSGRAVDISVGGRPSGRRSTHGAWVEFRRWVTEQQGGAFRLIGTPERTWDWPHVEYVGARAAGDVGGPLYPTVDALVAAARACRAATASETEAAERCTVASPRPAAGVQTYEVTDDAPARHARRGRRGTRRTRSHGAKRSRTTGRHAAGSHNAPAHHGSHGTKAHHAPKHRSAH